MEQKFYFSQSQRNHADALFLRDLIGLKKGDTLRIASLDGVSNSAVLVCGGDLMSVDARLVTKAFRVLPLVVVDTVVPIPELPNYIHTFYAVDPSTPTKVFCQ